MKAANKDPIIDIPNEIIRVRYFEDSKKKLP
jgi:hypothetical protein